MKKSLLIIAAILVVGGHVQSQSGPEAGNWKTWFISSGKDFRLPAPREGKDEVAAVLARQRNLDSATLQNIIYWNAGSPSYRWQTLMGSLWITDTGYNGSLAGMLMNVAVYDATVAAWNTKYAYKRARPFTDNRVKLYTATPESPSYPCEHSVAAGASATIIAHFYPALADSVNRMAARLMDSRIAAGVAYPSDTRAGFELGKQIALHEIEKTKDFTPKTTWDRKIPDTPGLWKGKFALLPLAGKSKTVVLSSGSELRPPPPPDFAREMAELKAFKQTFRSQSNAFAFANTGEDVLSKKIFEYNIHLDPPRAARIYAISAIASYDAFIACWDAKYAYWGIRPDQYDTTYRPLIGTPPFPGYPSGHAVICGMTGELYSYFFPLDRAYFQKRAKDGAESRFQAGIHFRSDNEVGLDLGRKVAERVIEKVKSEGVDNPLVFK